MGSKKNHPKSRAKSSARPKGTKKHAKGEKKKPPSKPKRQPAKNPPHKTPSLVAVIFFGAALGWFLGQYGLPTWPLIVFLLAAVWGLVFPAQLERSLDQHKNIARQVGDKDWTGASKIPLADIATGFLLLAWIVLLGLSVGRYPRPLLLNSTIGSLCASLGVVFRSGFTAWRKGVPTVPYEKDPLEKALKSAGAEKRNSGGGGSLLLAFVVLQAAAGQVMLGGTFGHVLLGLEKDLLLGAVLLSASGAEMALLLVRYRLQPIGDRASSLLKAMK